jgi:hypothetical protein
MGIFSCDVFLEFTGSSCDAVNVIIPDFCSSVS